MLKMRDRKMQRDWKMWRDWKMRDQYAGLENAGLENGETTLYGTPCIPFVCSVLQDATIDYV